jgi:hypothetical protein
MRAWLICLAVLAVGCSGEDYELVKLPAQVHMSPELSPEYADGVRVAVGEWHAALGVTVVNGVDSSKPAGCGIFVRYAEAGEMPDKRRGDAQVTKNCFGVIRLSRDMDGDGLRVTLVHEIGHLLNGDNEHSEDTWSVMFGTYLSPDVSITDSDVARVLARM